MVLGSADHPDWIAIKISRNLGDYSTHVTMQNTILYFFRAGYSYFNIQVLTFLLQLTHFFMARQP